MRSKDWRCTEVNDAFLTTVISHIFSWWNSIFFTIWWCTWPHLSPRVAWLPSLREWHDSVSNLKEPFFKNFFQGENCILQPLLNCKHIWQKNTCKNSCYHRIALFRKAAIMVDAFRQKAVPYYRYLWCVRACRKDSIKHNLQAESKENFKERCE